MENKLIWHTERTNDGFDHKGEEDKFQDAYKSLIKESAQNSLDAVDSLSKKAASLFDYDDVPVNIEYQIIELSGKAKELWKKAVDYDGTYKKFQNEVIRTLKPSQKSGADTQSKESDLKKIMRSKELLEGTDPIYILNIIDTNTVGLDGLDKKTKDGEYRRFASLFRSTKTSIKGKGAGSWGLGKNSYTNVSHLGLFLTCSNPKDINIPGIENDSTLRIFGMAINNQALLENVEEDTYLSSYWNFGATKSKEEASNQLKFESDLNQEFPGTNWAKSSWNNKEIADKLLVNQLGSNHGTVVQIPALKVDEFESKNVLEELKNKLINESSLWLWPAILSGKLKVTISTYKVSETFSTTSKDSSVNIDSKLLNSMDKVKPYCEIFSKIKNKEIFDTELDKNVKYLKIEDIAFHIPSEKDEEVKKIKEPHFPKLYMNLVSVNELQNEELQEFRNSVAYLRGPGIVVKYEKIDPKKEYIAYAGVLFGGTSHTVNLVNKNAEAFIRLSENPSHNTWWPPKSDNKLFVYFGDKDHAWDWGRSRNRFLLPVKNKISRLFAEATEESGNRNKWMELMYKISKKEKPEKTHSISGTRIDTNKIRVTVKLDANEEIILALKPAQVSQLYGNETGGYVEIKDITNKDKNEFKEVKTKNLNVIKSNNKLKINAFDTAKTFHFDVLLKDKTASNIIYGDAPLKFNYEQQDYPDWREES